MDFCELNETSGRKRKREQMVKHYFQLMNDNELRFVLEGDKKDLIDLVHKEFEKDKTQALKELNESLKQKEVTLAQLESIDYTDEGDKLENDCKIANLKKSIYDNKKEIERVSRQEKSNLTFYEMTPVEL